MLNSSNTALACGSDAAADAGSQLPLPRPADRLRALRRHAAASCLEDATLTWMARLPRDVQPRALAHRYARIANHLASIWKSGHHADAYLDELLVDRRGNRQGFPLAIAAELRRLVKYRHARQQVPAGDSRGEARLGKFSCASGRSISPSAGDR